MRSASTSSTVTPFEEISREDWARLSQQTPLPLSEADVDRLRGLGDRVDLSEVDAVYRPISRLLNIQVAAAQALRRSREDFLNQHQQRTPYIIGVAGSVAVGKSTTARLLRELMARWPDTPRVQLVTTDGFLYPNRVLEARGIMQRKGFPESYDRRRLLRFMADVKAGQERVEAPVYSHLTYDILEDEMVVVEQPDVLIVEGLNVLQPARPRRDGKLHVRLRLLRLLRLRRRAPGGCPALVREPLPQAQADGVLGSALLLPPLRRAHRRRGDPDRAAHLEHDQRPEPHRERGPHPRPRRPRAAQG